MSGPASKQRPPDDVRSRRIGWRAASRLVDGQDGGPGTEGVRTLITLASVPMYSIAAHTGSAQRDAAHRDVGFVRDALREASAPDTSPVPEALLAAFRESAAVTPTTRVEATAVRRQPATRTVVLRFGAAVLVVCGAGAAAATVGVLPAGVQHIAHEYLGVGSDPAPSTPVASSSAATSPSPSGSSGRASAAATTGATSTSTVISLCRQLPEDGDDWRSGLSAADQATLVAAAGDEDEVKTYCAQLLKTVSSSTAPKGKPSPSKSAEPSPQPAQSKPSPTPKARPTPTRGNPHPSHAPASTLARPSSSPGDSH